mmetsp:Transcript_9348/g.24510  ORF Transcript_9348/g.24510 Transcript_9348/m.24510 type:complete len:221 (+) Transcript_9348:803-1465(+)
MTAAPTLPANARLARCARRATTPTCAGAQAREFATSARPAWMTSTRWRHAPPRQTRSAPRARRFRTATLASTGNAGGGTSRIVKSAAPAMRDTSARRAAASRRVPVHSVSAAAPGRCGRAARTRAQGSASTVARVKTGSSGRGASTWTRGSARRVMSARGTAIFMAAGARSLGFAMIVIRAAPTNSRAQPVQRDRIVSARTAATWRRARRGSSTLRAGTV